MDPLIGRMESGLRLKILSSTRRKDFFAHLKGAQQVHFANKIAEPGKCRFTRIHPSGLRRVHPTTDVTIHTVEDIHQRRLFVQLPRKTLLTLSIPCTTLPFSNCYL